MTVPNREVNLELYKQLESQKIDYSISVDRGYLLNPKHFRGHFKAILTGFKATEYYDYFLLIEDDIELCEDFMFNLKEVIEITGKKELYSLMTVSDQLKDVNGAFLVTPSISWDQATLIRVDILADYVNFVREYLSVEKTKHGCASLSIFAYSIGYNFFIPSPTLVQHKETPSTLGNQMFGKKRISSNFKKNIDIKFKNVIIKKKSFISESKLNYQLK